MNLLLIKHSFFQKRFHGEGTLHFSNGSKYVGKWEKGIAVEVNNNANINTNVDQEELRLKGSTSKLKGYRHTLKQFFWSN